MKKILGTIVFFVVLVTVVLVVVFWPSEKSKNTPTPGTIDKVALATHLTKVGAKMYGAYWCSACTKQKELFGEIAFSKINYVECDPKGQNPKFEECQKEEIGSFPTWILDGKKYEGVRGLEELAQISGFKQ